MTYSKAMFISVHSELELKGQTLISPAFLISYNVTKLTLKSKVLANEVLPLLVIKHKYREEKEKTIVCARQACIKFAEKSTSRTAQFSL